jgi:hypothetical protein
MSAHRHNCFFIIFICKYDPDNSFIEMVEDMQMKKKDNENQSYLQLKPENQRNSVFALILNILVRDYILTLQTMVWILIYGNC